MVGRMSMVGDSDLAVAAIRPAVLVVWPVSGAYHFSVAPVGRNSILIIHRAYDPVGQQQGCDCSGGGDVVHAPSFLPDPGRLSWRPLLPVWSFSSGARTPVRRCTRPGR